MSTEQFDQLLKVTQENIFKNPLKDKDQKKLALCPNYMQGIRDAIRTEVYFNTVISDTSEETLDENGYFQIYDKGLQDGTAAKFFGLNSHQDSFLFRALGDIKEAVDNRLNHTLLKIEIQEKSSLELDSLKKEKDEVCKNLSNWNQLHPGEYNQKIEINLIQDKSKNKKYQCTVTQKNAITKDDLYAVSCVVEFDEENQMVFCKEIKKRWSSEVANYLGIEELGYDFSDEISYSLVSNFEKLWEKEKRSLLATLKKYKAIEKKEDYVKEIAKLEEFVKKYMSEKVVSLRHAAEECQPEDVENAIADIQKSNKAFMHQIKLKLKQLYRSKEKKDNIDKEFDLHLAHLQIKARQPFIDKAIDNIDKHKEIFSVDPKLDVRKAREEILLGEVLKAQLVEKSNYFFEKIEPTSIRSIKNQFIVFSNDFNKSIEASGLAVPESTWKPIFDLVSRGLNEIGFSSVASVVDNISHFIFGRTKYEVAKKGCEMLKALSNEWKDLPGITPAVM